MRRFRIRQFALAASALTAICAAPAWAQDGQQPEEASASDIVVTARRIEERLQDVPISITVYNQEQLTARNVVNATDLATYTPSLTINSRFGPEKSSFAIRGFSQDLNTLPTVGVYLADVVAPRLASNITSGNGAGVGAMMDLQNVQVLKGPQGTLFGRNTTGGAILLVPQKPKDKLGGYIEGSIGNHGMVRGQVMINVPVSETIRVRAVVDRYKRDGWLNNRSGIGPDKLSDSNYVSARLSVAIDLTPDLENYTIFTYARSHTSHTTGKIALCNPTSATSFGTAAVNPLRDAMCAQLARETAQGFGYYDVSNSNPNANLLSRTWQVINTTTWEASDSLTIKNILSYGQSKEDYSFNISGDLPIVAGQTVATPFVTTNPGPNNGQGDQWTLTEELQFQGSIGGDRLVWQAGGYLEYSEPNKTQQQYTATLSNCTNIHAFQCTSLTALGGSVGVAQNDYFFRNYGLYAQATYKFTDRLSITAGIRNTWDRVRVEGNNIRVTPSPAGPLAFSCSRAVTPTPNPGAALLTSGACGIGRTFETKSSEPTWLIGLEFKPTQDMLLYAKYSRGYRGGGVNEANRLAEVWAPEFVDTYEVGFKGSFDGAIRGNVAIAGFWNNFRDQQVSVFIPQCVNTVVSPDPLCTAPAFTGINGIQNLGKSRLRGIEIDGSIFLIDDLRLDFGYAYIDAKVTGAGTVVCARASFACERATFLSAGSVLPYAPKNRVTLTATYTLPVPEEVGTIDIGATFTHTDKYFSNHGGDAAFAAGLIPFNPSISPATDLLNLSMTWKDVGGKPLDLGLFATNVTGKKYHVAAANSLATTGGEFLFLGEPRMFGARLKYRFGD